MSDCAAWKASMICWVTAWELPGLDDQKVISLAGVTFDQSTSALGAAAPPPPDVLGPPHAASAAAGPTAPARPRKRRRSRAAPASADIGLKGGRATMNGPPGRRDVRGVDEGLRLR